MVRPLIPLPSHYAVIRIDSEGMVRDLGLEDAQTLREVRSMSKKKYLVFLQWPEELPMPDMRWCRYEVAPIGTTLRPPDETRGISSDMVIPIAPNQHCTGERRPVNPTPSFPFSNCYHWIMNSVTVRVRVHQDGVEHDRAIKLPPAERYALNKGFSPDCQRIGKFLRDKHGSSSARNDGTEPSDPIKASSTCGDDTQKPGLIDAKPSLQGGGRIDVLTDTYLRLVTQRGLRRSGPPSQSDASVRSPNHSSEDVLSGSREAQKQSTVTPMTSRDSGVDVFGWDPDPNTAKLPLVDAWLDIDKHLTEDDIPSPLELQKEIEEITAIVARGLARFASTQKTFEQIKEEHPVSDTEPPVGPGELEETDCCVETLNGLWRELRAQYVNSSSSCDPPFPELVVPASADLDDVDGTVIPPSSLRREDAVPLHTNVLEGLDTPPPVVMTGNGLEQPPACGSSSEVPARRLPSSPARSLKTRFIEHTPCPAAPAAISSSKKHPVILRAVALQSSESTPLRSITNVPQLQPPPSRRRNRASTVYHRLRAKFVNFLHPGRVGEVH
ncbi:hypothetical protein C8T65DRAFT_662152 [Cerioporus squamosus]|nr:hypothetical protein C8T65DRAFT_662152 [Cerioporus squamosus]